MRAAELEGKFAEYGGYDAEARAGSILTDAGIPESLHNGPMREVPPGLKLRVLLAQALFSQARRAAAGRADQQPRHQFDPLARRRAQRLRRHDDHHQPRPALPEPGVHAHRRSRFPAAEDLSGQLRRLHAGVRAGAGRASKPPTPRPRTGSRTCRNSCGASPPTPPRRARRPPARGSSRRSRSRRSGPPRARTPTSASSRPRSCTARRSRWRSSASAIRAPTTRCSTMSASTSRRRAHRHHRPQRRRQDHADALSRRRAGATAGRIVWVENAQPGYMPQDPQAEFDDKMDLFTWMSQYTGKADDDQIVRATLGPAAVLGRGDQEIGEGAVGRREGPHDLRQADADQAQRAADGRADQPHGHGDHRIAADRPGEISRAR